MVSEGNWVPAANTSLGAAAHTFPQGYTHGHTSETTRERGLHGSVEWWSSSKNIQEIRAPRMNSEERMHDSDVTLAMEGYELHSSTHTEFDK